jgi:hypothetical protein
MPDQKKDFPKVPPFIIKGTSGKAEQEPDTQPAHIVQPPIPSVKNDRNTSHLGMYSTLSLLIGVISMGVALMSGAWFAYDVLSSESTNAILSKVIVVGLAYLIGWIFSTFGIRILGNLILPYAVQIYAWVALGGIIILQILIMSRLYQQEYQFSNFVKYLSLFGAGMIALVGLHLILEKHSLRPFGVLVLLTSLGHLYSIVYHYVFIGDAIYEKLWGDVIFFFVTFFFSILMLAHFGLLKGMRRLINRMFDPITNRFVPPS